MNQVDKISKEVLDLLRYAKDTAKSNLVTANSNGQLESQLSDAQLNSVLSVVDSSLSQGYLKGLTSFQNSLKNIVSLEDNSKKRK